MILIFLYFSVPEIEQGLSEAAKSKVTVSFTPHLMPMVTRLDMLIRIVLGLIFAYDSLTDIFSLPC